MSLNFVSLEKAADMVGLSKRQFTRYYVERYDGPRFEIPGSRVRREYIYRHDLEVWAERFGYVVKIEAVS